MHHYYLYLQITNKTRSYVNRKGSSHWHVNVIKRKVIETNQIRKPRYINNFNCIIEEIL